MARTIRSERREVQFSTADRWERHAQRRDAAKLKVPRQSQYLLRRQLSEEDEDDR